MASTASVQSRRFETRFRNAVRSEIGIAGDTPLFLYVGDLRKGIEPAIRALAVGARRASARRLAHATGAISRTRRDMRRRRPRHAAAADEPGRTLLRRRRCPRPADALRCVRHGAHRSDGVRAPGDHDADGRGGGASDRRRPWIRSCVRRPTSTASAAAMRRWRTTSRRAAAWARRAAALMREHPWDHVAEADAGRVRQPPRPPHAAGRTGGELTCASPSSRNHAIASAG